LITTRQAASARSAACLVDINVGLGGLDPELSRRAARAAADAGDAAGRATTSAERAGRERLFRAVGVVAEGGWAYRIDLCRQMMP
jgi:hypothetical protein